MKNRFEFIVLGMALFAMFFGAGNLIFPPSIGFTLGSDWFLGMLGFFATGVGLPMLGVLAFNKIGSLDNFAIKVSKKFNFIYCSFLIIALGPLLAIPRTGATTYEMGIVPIFGNINPLIISFIYFGITLSLVLNPSKIIDMIGKVLTPIILIMLTFIIVKGVSTPIAPIAPSTTESPFSFGFLGGYQTMDALGSILMGAVIMSSIISKGYKDRKIQKELIVKSSIVAGIGLALVYGGLLYLGATTSSITKEFSNTSLTMFIAASTLGNLGKVALGLCVSAACLTTSVGLVTVVGEYFSKFNKFSYKQIVTATCIFSSLMAVIGVDAIVKIAVPILTLLYPITIILIFLNLLEVKSQNIFRGMIGVAMFFSFIEIGHVFFDISLFSLLFNNLILAKEGFIWLVPSIAIGVFYLIKDRFLSKNELKTIMR